MWQPARSVPPPGYFAAESVPVATSPFGYACGVEECHFEASQNHRTSECSALRGIVKRFPSSFVRSHGGSFSTIRCLETLFLPGWKWFGKCLSVILLL